MKTMVVAVLVSVLVSGVSGVRADDTVPVKKTAQETRQLLRLPPKVRVRFLAGMRQHLAEISDIQAALAQGEFDRAAQIAEDRLGLGAPDSAPCRMDSMADAKTGKSAAEAFPRIASRLGGGGIAPYMPKAMHDVGVRMHQAADHFAKVSRASAAAKDYPAALSALNAVTTQCIACHAQFGVADR